MHLSDNKTVCPDDYVHASNGSISLPGNATFEAEVGGTSTYAACFNSTSLPPSAVMCRAENKGSVGPWYVCVQDGADADLTWEWTWRALLLVFTLLCLVAWTIYLYNKSRVRQSDSGLCAAVCAWIVPPVLLTLSCGIGWIVLIVKMFDL